MATYEIWIMAPHTGDRRELVNTYYNRGHAVAKLRGLRRQAKAVVGLRWCSITGLWLYRSEMSYAQRLYRSEMSYALIENR